MLRIRTGTHDPFDERLFPDLQAEDCFFSFLLFIRHQSGNKHRLLTRKEMTAYTKITKNNVLIGV